MSGEAPGRSVAGQETGMTDPPWAAGPPPPPPSDADPTASLPGSQSGHDGGGSGPASSTSSAHHWRPGRHRSPVSGGTTALKAGVSDLTHRSPWVLGAGAVLVALVLTWLASAVLAFRHAPGTTSQERVIQFFAPGALDWGVAVLLGVALVAAGRRFDMRMAGPDALRDAVSLGLCLMALVVGVSAAIDVLVELTNFGHGIDVAFSGLLAHAAALPLAAVAAWWAERLHTEAES
jgi:multisubunit Na+/H+ antiporter MnhF subunit